MSRMSDYLDYSVDDLGRRLAKVNSIIDENQEMISDYHSKHLNVNLNQNSSLSEDSPMSKDLERLATYLIRQSEKEDKNVETLNDYKKKRDEKNEADLFMNYNHGMLGYTKEDSEIMKKNIKRRKKAKVKVTEEDRVRHEELRQSGNMIKSLTESIKNGFDSTGTKVSEQEVRKMKWIRSDIQRDETVMKIMLNGYITFQSITKHEKDYMALSHVRYDDEECVRILLKHYYEFKDIYEEDTFGYGKIMMMTFDELLEKSNFEPYILEVCSLRSLNVKIEEVVTVIFEKYGVKLNNPKISEITRNIVPKKIVETYKNSKEEYIFTHHIKGEYKSCTKCKNVLLAIPKYFTPRNNGKLRADCKACRNANERKASKNKKRNTSVVRKQKKAVDND